MFFRSLILSSIFSSSLAATISTVPAPTVTISNGVVVGKKTTISNQPSVTAQANAFLGIPYAQPPARFAPPVAAASWSGQLKAVDYKATCIQQISGNEQIDVCGVAVSDFVQGSDRAAAGGIGAPTLVESEDCLYLNVWAPGNATATSNLPVLFWIYGGNLQFGSGSLPAYDGTSFAVNYNVVVVTINYRTNIFGFSNSPEIPLNSQNSGFLDQRLALQWVTKNIDKFGGNPGQVQIFGESAGGESVKQLLAQPPSPLPFTSAILESEQSGLFGDGLANYKNVLAHFNCKDLACIRTIDAVSIRKYIENATLAFPPVADVTYVTDIRNSINKKTFAKVPILIGTNLNEARTAFGAIAQNNGSAAINAVFAQYGINNTDTINQIFSNYSNQGVTALVDVADRVATDLVFTCTTSNIAKYLAANGYTVWRYRYDASFPNTSPFPGAGAYHSSEIFEVFGTYPLSNQYGTVTDQQKQLSAFMQNLWSGFAKNPIVQPPWPRIGSNFGYELGDLGLNGNNGYSLNNTFAADYACPLYGGLEDALRLSW